MATSTSNYSFILPAVNSAVDEDLWGTSLNLNWTNLDTYINTRQANYDFAAYELSDALMVDTAEKVYNLGSVSGDVAIDYTNGHWQYGTITGDITNFSVSNWPATGRAGFITLDLTQDGTGGHSVTLSDPGFVTVDGNVLTPSTLANANNEFYLRTRTAGVVTKINLGSDFK